MTKSEDRINLWKINAESCGTSIKPVKLMTSYDYHKSECEQRIRQLNWSTIVMNEIGRTYDTIEFEQRR